MVTTIERGSDTYIVHRDTLLILHNKTYSAAPRFCEVFYAHTHWTYTHSLYKIFYINDTYPYYRYVHNYKYIDWDISTLLLLLFFLLIFSPFFFSSSPLTRLWPRSLTYIAIEHHDRCSVVAAPSPEGAHRALDPHAMELTTKLKT